MDFKSDITLGVDASHTWMTPMGSESAHQKVSWKIVFFHHFPPKKNGRDVQKKWKTGNPQQHKHLAAQICALSQDLLGESSQFVSG